MAKTAEKKTKRAVRHRRIRSTVSGTKEQPRLAVFRSNRYISAQLIDDTAGHVLASATSQKAKEGTLVAQAHNVGKEIAEQSQKNGIKKAVFDRAGFPFTGAVKAVAEGARENGLTV